MRRYRVPSHLRSTWREGLEPRLLRALQACGAVALVLLIVLWIVPARQHAARSLRRAPHTRTARAIVPPRPVPPAPPVAAVTPKPEPRRPTATPKAAPKPRPTPKRDPLPPRGKPDAPPRGGGGASPPGSPAPVAGKRGQEAAAQVAANLSSTTSGVDQLLASLDGKLPSAGKKGGGGNAVGALRRGLQGGRGTDALAGIDNLLQGSGAGTGGGPARGIAKGGVDVVDQGIQSDGAGSGATGRDSRSLMAVVERYKSGVKFCYDNALKKAPQLAGKITLQMDIAPSGAVTQVQVVHDGLGDASLQRCIQAQVMSWRFPAIDAGTVRFTLPLVFSPPKG